MPRVILEFGREVELFRGESWVGYKSGFFVDAPPIHGPLMLRILHQACTNWKVFLSWFERTSEFVTVENRALSISTEDNSPIALFCVEKQSRATCSPSNRENRRQSRAFPALRISYFIDWVVIGKFDWLRRFWLDESHFECTTLRWNCVIY